MERFGLHVRGNGRTGIGGLPETVVAALFDRYDSDASGQLSFREFSEGFLRRHQTFNQPLPAEEYSAPTLTPRSLGEDPMAQEEMVSWPTAKLQGC